MKFILLPFAALLLLTPPPASSQQNVPRFRSEANVVLVPTLARNADGQIVYGLTAQSFVVEDNGVEQAVTLDGAPSAQPISLVLAIQVGRTAALTFTKESGASARDTFYSPAERKDCRLRKLPCSTSISGLSSMLEALVDETHGEVAVLTFDSQVRLFQNFTEDTATLTRRLKLLTPGDNGAAILDAARSGLELLKTHSKHRLRVLILISESRDHGSRVETASDLTQQLTMGDTLVYSLTFSPWRSQFSRYLHHEPDESDTPGSLLAPIAMIAGGMGKNIPHYLAMLTGGEDFKFKDKQSFDSGFAIIDDDVRNQYLLSFEPKDLKPGPHILNVRLREPAKDVMVIARHEYWARGTLPVGSAR